MIYAQYRRPIGDPCMYLQGGDVIYTMHFFARCVTRERHRQQTPTALYAMATAKPAQANAKDEPFWMRAGNTDT